MNALRSLAAPAALIGVASIIVIVTQSGSVTHFRAASDEFWAPRVAGLEAETFDSLEAMSDAADLIVRGQVTDVREGRKFLADEHLGDQGYTRYAVATVRIDEVISERGGTPISKTLQLEIFAPSRTSLEGLVRNASHDEAIFVLENKGLVAEELGLPASVVRDEANYWMLATSEAIVRQIDGKAATLVGADSPYMSELDGRPFEAIVQEFRDLATR